MAILPALMMCHGGTCDHCTTKVFSGSKPLHRCYIAVNNKDTAYLDVFMHGKRKIKGHLLIRNFNKPKNEGELTGQLKHDTLFLQYHFYVGMDSIKMFTNPLALLQRKDTLILGVGKILTSLGRSYFDHKVPIDFRKGKFYFRPIKCK